METTIRALVNRVLGLVALDLGLGLGRQGGDSALL